MEITIEAKDVYGRTLYYPAIADKNAFTTSDEPSHV